MRTLLLLAALLFAGPALAQTSGLPDLAGLLPAGDSTASGRIVQLFGISDMFVESQVFCETGHGIAPFQPNPELANETGILVSIPLY